MGQRKLPESPQEESGTLQVVIPLYANEGPSPTNVHVL